MQSCWMCGGLSSYRTSQPEDKKTVCSLCKDDSLTLLTKDGQTVRFYAWITSSERHRIGLVHASYGCLIKGCW